jgi:hypothetical protein
MTWPKSLLVQSLVTLARLWCLIALGPWFSPLAASATLQMVNRRLPAAAVLLAPTGRLEGGTQLKLAIALPLRNQAALTKLLADIYNPASPHYRNFLTPEQFTAQFGPSPQDYEAVARFARQSGLTITATHSNRLILDVQGSVSAIQKALNVTMQTYRHPSDARQFYAPATDPSLALSVPLAGISGLDNYALPKPRIKVQPAAQTSHRATANAGSGPAGTYMGYDFRGAYIPNSTLTGVGQTIGLLQFDGYTTSDITYYESQAGLPNVPITNVLLDGFNGAPSLNGGEIEVSLDIEMAISMAPGISQLIVYEAGLYGNWHDILNRIATDNLAKQISCSWYVPGGPADPVADAIFQQMAAQGQSFYSASGDYDAFTGLIPFPGDTPYVTEVGGTTLTTGANGAWDAEQVWNWGQGIGSGGGISTQYAIPSWQQAISMAGNQGSTTMRNVPDVALTADNVYVRADGIDQGAGGTSCAAPLWAAFTALINQQAISNGLPPVGFINPAIYNLALTAGYGAEFHDITTGNNFSPSSPNLQCLRRARRSVFALRTDLHFDELWRHPPDLDRLDIPALGYTFRHQRHARTGRNDHRYMDDQCYCQCVVCGKLYGQTLFHERHHGHQPGASLESCHLSLDDHCLQSRHRPRLVAPGRMGVWPARWRRRYLFWVPGSHQRGDWEQRLWDQPERRLQHDCRRAILSDHERPEYGRIHRHAVELRSLVELRLPHFRQ